MPQQQNGYDCGVYALMAIDALLNAQLPAYSKAAIESALGNSVFDALKMRQSLKALVKQLQQT